MECHLAYFTLSDISFLLCKLWDLCLKNGMSKCMRKKRLFKID